MPFHAGSATDFNDLLQKLRDFAVNQHVITAAVSSGGTGYVVGDVLTVAGGTTVNGLTATLEVTSVAAGVIDGIRVLNYGAYSALPSTPNSPTGGTGSGASITLTFDTALWTLQRDITYGSATSVSAIGAGGSGYTVSDVVSVASQGSLFLASPMTFTVDAVDGGGAITAASVNDGGQVLQSAGGAFAVTGGTGTGASIDPVIDVPDNFDLQIWLTSTNGDNIQLGAKMFIQGNDNFAWSLRGATGYDSGQDFFAQPGTSGGDTFVPLALTTIRFWFFVNEKRIIVVGEQGGIYPNLYLGFLDRFGTETEYPYPLVVGGCCSSDSLPLFESSQVNMSGLCDPLAASSAQAGPFRVRDVQDWRTFRNSTLSGSTRSATNENVVFPCGENGTGHLAADENWFGDDGWDDFIPDSGNPGNPVNRLLATPNGANFEYPLIPATVIEGSPDDMILGELDGVFWVSRGDGAELLNSEDVIEQNGSVFLVFQNVGRTQTFTFLAVRRD